MGNTGSNTSEYENPAKGGAYVAYKLLMKEINQPNSAQKFGDLNDEVFFWPNFENTGKNIVYISGSDGIEWGSNVAAFVVRDPVIFQGTIDAISNELERRGWAKSKNTILIGYSRGATLVANMAKKSSINVGGILTLGHPGEVESNNNKSESVVIDYTDNSDYLVDTSNILGSPEQFHYNYIVTNSGTIFDPIRKHTTYHVGLEKIMDKSKMNDFFNTLK